MIGGHCRTRGGFFANAVSLPLVRHEERRLQDRAAELAAFVGLESVTERVVADLPFGIRSASSLRARSRPSPKLLLLDEPAAGLNHQELERAARAHPQIRDRLGVTILLVEHHMNLVMTRLATTSSRSISAARSPTERRRMIQKHPDVIRRLSRNHSLMAALLLGCVICVRSTAQAEVLHGIDFALDEGGITACSGPMARARPRPCARYAAW